MKTLLLLVLLGVIALVIIAGWLCKTFASMSEAEKKAFENAD